MAGGLRRPGSRDQAASSRQRSTQRACGLLCTVTILLLIGPAPAQATSFCTDHKQIFVRHSSTTSRWGVRGSNGPEYDWTGMTCVFDDAPGWQWKPLAGSTNDYDVVSGSGDC